MLAKKVYKIWAPAGKKWVDWVRPVPFIGIDNDPEIHEFIDYMLPQINYLEKASKDTAIIVDIEGVESVKEGISLAFLGYRPIPVFNGTIPQYGVRSNVNNEIIEPLLVWGANELQHVKIKDSAPPAFLLDNNRLMRYRINRTIFDSSWDIYDQDLPSANYLLKNGIKKVIIRTTKLAPDIKKILYKYQKAGLIICFSDGFEESKKIIIKKPKKEPL